MKDDKVEVIREVISSSELRLRDGVTAFCVVSTLSEA